LAASKEEITKVDVDRLTLGSYANLRIGKSIGLRSQKGFHFAELC
jgi:hypothetical protein